MIAGIEAGRRPPRSEGGNLYGKGTPLPESLLWGGTRIGHPGRHHRRDPRRGLRPRFRRDRPHRVAAVLESRQRLGTPALPGQFVTAPRFGVWAPVYGNTGARTRRRARRGIRPHPRPAGRAERAGFDSALLAEHIVTRATTSCRARDVDRAGGAGRGDERHRAIRGGQAAAVPPGRARQARGHRRDQRWPHGDQPGQRLVPARDGGARHRHAAATTSATHTPASGWSGARPVDGSGRHAARMAGRDRPASARRRRPSTSAASPSRPAHSPPARPTCSSSTAARSTDTIELIEDLRRRPRSGRAAAVRPVGVRDRAPPRGPRRTPSQRASAGRSAPSTTARASSPAPTRTWR